MFTLPLTPQQKRLWVEWKLDPNGHYYNVNVQFKLRGNLDKERFIDAIKEATTFFESFRTYFAEEEGLPQQIILPQTEILIEYKDLSAHFQNESDREVLGRDIFKQETRKPINLKRYPIMRFLILRISEDLHYFIMINAHILSDAPSAQFMFEAISAIYNRDAKVVNYYQNNKNLSICDYLKSDMLKSHNDVEYWAKKLSDSPLQVKVGSGQAKTKQGRRHYFDLDEESFKALKSRARKEAATVFTFLAAAYAVFLARYFDQKDIVFTYPVNIRGAQFPKIYGFYVSNIPLRINLEKDVPFREVIKQVTDKRRIDRDYERCSLDEILKSLRRTKGILPDFPFNISFGQTWLSLQSLNLQGITAEIITCDPAETYSDLSLQYDTSTSILKCYWEYKTELFSNQDIENLTESFLTFLHNVIQDPHVSIRDITILSHPQRTAIQTKARGAFQDPRDSRKSAHSIMQPIEGVARDYPDKIALKTRTESITYAAFDARVNQVAQYLIEKGVGKNTYVAVCLDRSAELIITLAAVLKAGAAYVPIDPKYPQQRMQEIIKDCAPRFIISSQSYSDKFSASSHLLYCIDNTGIAAEIHKCSSQKPSICITGDDIAYVIYTSGSTGKPKGVLVSHGNVNARLVALQKIVSLTREDKALQTINYCFDPSVFEIFWPLGVGATLVLPKPDINQDPESLIEVINQEKVTFFSSVPSLLRILMQKVAPGDCQSLRNALCGGEVLPPLLATNFLNTIPARLFNAYGPTEATILACYYECQKNNPAILPIGKPLDNSSVYIVNQELQLQPDGAIGEICIGGQGIARGYLNRPDLTHEKFVPDPFSETSGAKLYKTGDLGRYLPDGNIEFIGRIDRQIKIRGFRVELGEIEHAIAGVEGIKQAAVLVRQGEQGNKIIGYYSPDHFAPEEMRKRLEIILPEHMVPAHLIALSQMPITANGKLDESALPEPQQSLPSVKITGSLTPVELKLRDIFARLLERPAERLGINEKFFDAGGDSLQAVELSVIIEKEFGVELPDTVIFEYPTITALARLLSSRVHAPQEVMLNLDQRMLKRQKMRNIRISARETI